MASGSWTFKTGNSYIQGKINWSSSSNGVSANSSRVTVAVYIRRTNSGYNSHGTVNTYGFVESQQSETGFSVSISDPNTWTLIFAKDWTVKHNSDGTKQVNIHVWGNGNFSIGSFDTNSTVTLDRIPRYTSINTWECTEVGKTYAKLKWASSDTADWVRVYLNDSSQWTDNPGSVSGTFGEFIYTGAATSGASIPESPTLLPGTTYKLKCWVRRKDSQLATTSGNISFTTNPVAKISNINNGFSIKVGSPLQLEFSNSDANKSKLSLYIQKENSEDYELIAETDEVIQQDSYLWDLSSISSVLYSKLSTRNSANIKLTCSTIIDENNQSVKMIANDIVGIISINEEESNPTFSTFSFGDEDTTTQKILNNTNYMPQGLGDMVVRIPTSNKAIAKNGASIVKYVLNVSGASALTKESQYSSAEEIVFNLGAFNNTGEHIISIYAVDSRGNTSDTISARFYVLQYSYPQFNLFNFGRLFDYEAETILDFVGSYSRLVVGSEDKNTNVTLKYRYCEADSSYPNTYTEIKGLQFSNSSNSLKKISFSQNTEDNTFGKTGEGSVQKLLLDINSSYKFEFLLTDKFIAIPYEAYIEKGIPIMFTGENGQVSIGMIPDITRDEKLQVNSDIIATDKSGNKIGILDRLDKLITASEQEPSDKKNGLWFHIVEILDEIYKVEPYLTSAAGNTKLMLSSNAVRMNDGTTVEKKISNINSNIDNRLTNVQKVKAGIKVININSSGANYVVVFTNKEINSLLEVDDSSSSNTMVTFANGNGAAQSVHIQGATYQNNIWYAVMDSGSVKGDIQINYVIHYFGTSTSEDTSQIKSQEKTVTSSISEQVVYPDEGYDYLSRVTVKSIPYEETTDSSGGTTVDIG